MCSNKTGIFKEALAPCHKTKVAMETFQRHQITAHLLGLNLIENLLSIVTERLISKDNRQH